MTTVTSVTESARVVIQKRKNLVTVHLHWQHTFSQQVAIFLSMIYHRVQPNSHTESFTCVFCKSFVIRPVEIQPCKSRGCSSCCIHAVSSGQTFSCPDCLESHQCNTSVFSKLSPIVEKILNELLVTCDRCGNPVTLVAAHDKCQNHMLMERVMLEELIQVPVDKELTNLEKKAAASLVS